MTAEKQVLYESIMASLQGLEERAVTTTDKINNVQLELVQRLGVYDGIMKGFSIAIKVLGGLCAFLSISVVSLLIYILQSKGVI